MSLPDLTPLLLFLQEGATQAAEGEAAPEAPSLLWPMLGIAAIFWFVMIAPERKRKKERASMITAMKKGDKVMTSSGMYGTIAQVQGDIVTLQIADNVRVKFALAAIQGLVDENAKKAAAGKDAKDDKALIPQKADGKKSDGSKDDAKQDDQNAESEVAGKSK